MIADTVPSPPRLASDRVLLARVALAAALTTPGVVTGDGGPGALRVTADPAGPLVGVAATATRDGRYTIDLRLVAELVPLRELADAVRAAVAAAAARGELAPLLGDVNVEVADLLAAHGTASPPPSVASTPGSVA